jgi:hypothetical protein
METVGVSSSGISGLKQDSVRKKLFFWTQTPFRLPAYLLPKVEVYNLFGDLIAFAVDESLRHLDPLSFGLGIHHFDDPIIPYARTCDDLLCHSRTQGAFLWLE